MVVAGPSAGLAVRRPVILSVTALLVGVAWVRDAAAHPVGLLLASLAFLAIAAIAQRWLGVPLPLGSLSSGLAFGILAATLFLLLPAAIHQGVWHVRPTLLPLAGAVSIGEEVAVRGLVYGMLSPAGAPAAVGLSTLVFALMHALAYGPAALPLLLAAGAVLGYLRWVSGGLAAPALAHTLADIVATAA